MISELSELRNEFEVPRKKYQEYLPKVDPALVDDLLKRQMKNPDLAPMYIVEVFTEPGLDPEKIRSLIIAKTGQCPAIYDKGTHYAVHQRLTLEELIEISDAKEVVEVTGEYSGSFGPWAASHERRPKEHDEEEGYYTRP
jgi:hypothetical protein